MSIAPVPIGPVPAGRDQHRDRAASVGPKLHALLANPHAQLANPFVVANFCVAPKAPACRPLPGATSRHPRDASKKPGVPKSRRRADPNQRVRLRRKRLHSRDHGRHRAPAPPMTTVGPPRQHTPSSADLRA
jgi:hypothetical protein